MSDFLSNEPVGAGWVCSGPGYWCPSQNYSAGSPGSVARLYCTTSIARGSSTTCTVTPSSGVTVSNWTFRDTNGVVVARSQGTGSLTWSGVMVIGGTVTVSASISGTTVPLSANIAVTSRNGFAFTAANPAQIMSNTLTCYSGASETLGVPPSATSVKGFSCADLAFDFTTAVPISDNGPNNGYQYISTVSSTSQGNPPNPTKYEFIVVSSVLSATTFYNAQCGTYSTANQAGFIAGSQLKQNIFDHEQGSVFSHWTEYRDAQNNVANNIGTQLEPLVAAPGTSQAAFITTATNTASSARDRIKAAGAVEPCDGIPEKDSSQSCKFCGTINYIPYVSCGNSQPVPYCQ